MGKEVCRRLRPSAWRSGRQTTRRSQWRRQWSLCSECARRSSCTHRTSTPTSPRRCADAAETDPPGLSLSPPRSPSPPSRHLPSTLTDKT
eukprot:6208844-Pleurochrysis_carterae.AAC.1